MVEDKGSENNYFPNYNTMTHTLRNSQWSFLKGIYNICYSKKLDAEVDMRTQVFSTGQLLNRLAKMKIPLLTPFFTLHLCYFLNL